MVRPICAIGITAASLFQVRAAVHAARGEPEAVEDIGALRLLQGGYVRPDGCGGRRVPDQAHELPLPLPRVQGRPSLLQVRGVSDYQ